MIADLNQPVLDAADGKFLPEEKVGISQAGAMALPFTEAEFDLLVCQFGVMFFPDKQASYHEAAQVLRAGGHYIFNTWGPMSANPFSAIAPQIVTRFFPDDPPGFYRVPFSCGDPVAAPGDLKSAGLKDSPLNHQG